MKSEWKVSSQYFGDTKNYIVYRILDTNEPMHSGNIEYFDGYGEDRAQKQHLADKLNCGLIPGVK